MDDHENKRASPLPPYIASGCTKSGVTSLPRTPLYLTAKMATWFTDSFDSPAPRYGEVTSAWKVTQENPVYFITNPVDSDSDKDNFGSVRFTIESHDQGVSSGNNFEGTFWSRFE